MAVGTSGRIVIDIDPSLKRRFHAALMAEGKSLKDWFLERCAEYMAERGQPRLFEAPNPQVPTTPEARR